MRRYQFAQFILLCQILISLYIYIFLVYSFFLPVIKTSLEFQYNVTPVSDMIV